MTEQEDKFSDYTPEQWLAIFKESLDESDLYESPFEFVAEGVLNMANYANWADLYYGFMFMETLRYVYSPIHHIPYDFKPQHIKLEEFLKEEFMIHYLAIVNMEPLCGIIDWGTSIRGAWIDHFNTRNKCSRGEITELGCDFVKDGEQIFPVLKTPDQYKSFFTALIMWFDEIVGELGTEKYKAIQEFYYSGNFNNLKNVSIFYPDKHPSDTDED